MERGASKSFSSVSVSRATWVLVTAPARGSRKTYFLYLKVEDKDFSDATLRAKARRNSVPKKALEVEISQLTHTGGTCRAFQFPSASPVFLPSPSTASRPSAPHPASTAPTFSKAPLHCHHDQARRLPPPGLRPSYNLQQDTSLSW